MTRISRRTFVGGSAALLAAGSLPRGLQAAMTTAPIGNSLSAVKHVVIFMQENRSFDHYFGALAGVRGFDDRSAVQLRNGNPIFMQPNLTHYALPFHLDTATTSAQCVSDLDHSWLGTHFAANGGKWDNWVAAKNALTMGYYTRADIPFHYALADAFTICDHYFCSVMGPTDPNRLYLWSGMIDPQATGGGPVTDNSTPGFSWTTYPQRLQTAGVSWKVYQNSNDNYDDNALAWFNQFRSATPGTPLHDRGMASVPALTGNTVADIAAALKNDVLNGTLPQVSWIIAPESASEHPSYAPATGAAMIEQILEALTADPTVWGSTVMLLNYDENDGFFDHMTPPRPPPGTPDEFAWGLPIGLGPRVPMIVMSPWSRGGYVCSQVFDHTSVLRFLEVWTGVREPNISAWRRRVCGDLTSALDFNRVVIAVPAMPDTAALAAQAASQCALLPAPAAPANQVMAKQESANGRPARALPYQPNAVARVDHAAGKLWIDMSNSGSETVHHAVYANNYRSDGPWQYDVDAGASTSDYFSVQQYGNGFYDLSLYGANGFLRNFTGNINGAGGNLEVASSYDFSTPGAAKIVLTMINNSSSSAIFTVASNAYRGDGPWTYTVAAGQRISDYWNAELYTHGWYDLTATANVDSVFARRFVGHIEVGTPSVSGSTTNIRTPTLSTVNRVARGANIVVNYATPLTQLSSTNWVGIYRAGQTPGQVPSIAWQYAANLSGALTFNTISLTAGAYAAWYCYSDGYTTLTGAAAFTVT